MDPAPPRAHDGGENHRRRELPGLCPGARTDDGAEGVGERRSRGWRLLGFRPSRPRKEATRGQQMLFRCVFRQDYHLIEAFREIEAIPF
jgi:hypothetical protein